MLRLRTEAWLACQVAPQFGLDVLAESITQSSARLGCLLLALRVQAGQNWLSKSEGSCSRVNMPLLLAAMLVRAAPRKQKLSSA